MTTTDEPVCSPGCQEGYTCEYRPYPCQEGMVCIAIVVPTCVPPKDSCGGCPDGQVCQLTGVACIRAPCPEANQCVRVSTPKPPAACNLACRRGYECQLRVPTCLFGNRRKCRARRVPTCVPKCPRTYSSRRRCPRWWKPKNKCSDDNDCRKKSNQRCCPSLCEWDVCTNVRR
ncbi:unnamed protein product [Lymnaea stagnalis]|uniref:WAP domain-containing protein n=1 Tax=Lymnaea stagnalis TaxID=6523 RepID=A0AAV2IB16_LYMST